MNPTEVTLLGYIAWMILLLLTLGLYRVSLVLRGKHRPNNFSPSGDDVSAFSARLCRVHANCYETFPIIGGILLYALIMDASMVSNTLAYYLLGARVLQSLIHLYSTSILAVQLRFVFFIVQIGICAYWLIAFLRMQLS